MLLTRLFKDCTVMPGQKCQPAGVSLLGAIGHGPSSPGKVLSAVMIGLGIIFAALAVNAGTRLGGAFTHGKGVTAPISPIGRVIFCVIALLLAIAGIKGLLA
jgi:hypothetical protein